MSSREDREGATHRMAVALIDVHGCREDTAQGEMLVYNGTTYVYACFTYIRTGYADT